MSTSFSRDDAELLTTVRQKLRSAVADVVLFEQVAEWGCIEQHEMRRLRKRLASALFSLDVVFPMTPARAEPLEEKTEKPAEPETKGAAMLRAILGGESEK